MSEELEFIFACWKYDVCVPDRLDETPPTAIPPNGMPPNGILASICEECFQASDGNKRFSEHERDYEKICHCFPEFKDYVTRIGSVVTVQMSG